MAVGYKPHIGKNVIETLTSGMYDDARFIYREYVQNAADQIDYAVEEKILQKKSDGSIFITINTEDKKITVADNATGIRAESVLQFLGDVAHSTKDKNKRKGFRGIGRLGGLGYCEKLIFETSYIGEEIKSTIVLDAKLLREIISDKSVNADASTVISVITSIDKVTASKDEHYFNVTLEDVTNPELLNEESVRNYLSMVAPVSYHHDFTFSKEIYEFFRTNNITIDEYNVFLNEKKLYKAYKNILVSKSGEPLSEVLGVNYFKIKSEEEELIAIGWYGITQELNFQIPSTNIERGIRLRKDNIEIGSQDTLKRFFKDPRFNLNYIGEVHGVSNNLIPNARRDYFNDNNTTQVLENKLKELFIGLQKKAYTTSEIYNRFDEIVKYKQKEQELQEKFKEGNFTSLNEEKHYIKELDVAKKRAVLAQKKIEGIKKKTEVDSDIRALYKNIIGEDDINVDTIQGKPIVSVEAREYLTEKLSKLNSQQREVVLEIFSVIDETLPIELAKTLRKKISERYN